MSDNKMQEPKRPPVPDSWQFCGICGSECIVFDKWLDIHICLQCGAREGTKGWQAPNPGRRKLVRILLLDDEAAIHEIVRSMLTKAGLEADITSAFDGDEALRLYKAQGPFDLVLTDIAHPGLEGHQLTQAIWKINPKQSCAFVTGFPVLSKPFTVQQLTDFVKRWR